MIVDALRANHLGVSPTQVSAVELPRTPESSNIFFQNELVPEMFLAGFAKTKSLQMLTAKKPGHAEMT